MQFLKTFLAFFAIFLFPAKSLTSCIEENQNDEENLSCIQLITEEKDIKPGEFLKCSKLAKEDKWIGYLCLCRINTLKGNIPLAKSFCFKAKEKNPFSPHSYSELANLYLKTRDLDNARNEIDFAIELSTSDFNSLYLAAKIYQQYNPQKSLKLYKESLKILEKSKKSYIIGKRTEIEQAIKDLKKEVSSIKTKEKEKRYLNCIERYKNEKDDLKAIELFEECSKIKEINDTSLVLQYLTLLHKNGMYNEVIKKSNLLKKEVLANRDKEKLYILLASSYYRIDEIEKAIFYYSNAYKINPDNVEVLKEYGNALEKDGNKLMAIEVYSKLYSITKDKNLYEKIDTLKLLVMSNDDILNDLKERGFLEKGKTTLLPDEKKLYYLIRLYEKKGAVEWLLKKYPGYAKLVMESKDGKKKLMPDGYDLFSTYVSQEAVKFFQKNNISYIYLFKLKDRNGKDIFTNKGKLTYEGALAYYKTLETGEKTWFYPQEVPVSKEEDRMNESEILEAKEKIKKLLKNGYEEISEEEYLYLANRTKCPDDVLFSHPCNLEKIKYGTKKYRYFACADLICVDGGDNYFTPLRLFSMIVDYREGRSSIEENAARNFFGTGPKKHTFCENGKIWMGPNISDEIIKQRLKEDMEKIESYKKKMEKAIKSYNPKPKI